ncbi:TonB-dependent receptor [bacterium]|jgi:outer membrane receptor protein involved in Fe transport|nr:TonB-dependent receptor [bacterium]
MKKLITLILFTGFLFSSNGKLTGTITQKSDNAPAVGVNIMITDTYLGAASGQDGRFVILNIPPGTYSVRVDAIGFAPVVLQNVRITTSQTTEINIKLDESVVEGQEVTVVAERPLIQKDLTASQRVTTAKEIADMPVESFLGVLSTHAGVNKSADGALHVRGGRSNEVGYYIGGVSMSNPFFTNSLAVGLSNKALEEMKLVSGAFNAEYGNAMSGVVNVKVKDGGKDYQGSLSYYAGDYNSNAEDIFPNISDQSFTANTTLDAFVSGPVIPGLGDKLTFNISVRRNQSEGYLNGIREHSPGDFAYFPPSGNWYIQMSGDSSYVPMNPSESNNFLSKFTWRLSPRIKISTQSIMSQSQSKSYSHAYKYNPDGIATGYTQNNNHSLQINHSLSAKSFYEGNVFFSDTDYKNYLYSDTLDQRYVNTDYINTEPTSATFLFGGTQMGHTYRNSKSVGGKFDFTSQISSNHEIKTGFSFRNDNLVERNLTVLYDQNFDEPTVLSENKSPYHIFYDKDAVQYSAYIQDKMEYSSMIMNLGIRYDAFVPNDSTIANLLYPEADQKEAKTKTMVSPRIGVSLPITDKGIFHFSYGHFYQMPTLRNLYRESYFGAGLAPTVGNPDLKPEKTVLYEFGFQQQFGNLIGMDFNVFHKDIRELLALQSIRYNSPNYGPSNYSIYLNKDYGSARGLTLSITKRYDPVSRTSLWVDYTYQKSEGNSVNSGSFYFSALSGTEEEKLIVPLSWDQSHLLNTTLIVGDPSKTTLGIIGKISTGWPYTPSIPNANFIPKPNSGRKPVQRNVDAKLETRVSVKGYRVALFVRVYNLFDLRNERYVFDDTGTAKYTYEYRSNQESEQLIENYGMPGLHTWEDYVTRPNYYSAPRSFKVGLSLDL